MAMRPTRLITILQSGQATKKEFDYETFNYTYYPDHCDNPQGSGQAQTFRASRGNVTAIREYGWGNPVVFSGQIIDANAPLMRTTTNAYLHDPAANSSGTASQYLAANIVNKILTQVIVDGQGGGTAAQTQYEYDNNASPYRGNATKVKRWRNSDNSWLPTGYTYDGYGNISSITDPGGHTTQWDYSDSFVPGSCIPASNSYAYVSKITNALGQQTLITRYACTGQKQSLRDQNDINAGRPGTTYTYDLMNRPLCTNSPDGGQTCLNYNGDSIPLTVTKTQLAAPDPNIVTSTVFDGLGRVKQTRIDSDPEGVDYTDTIYDAVGRVQSVSNPYRSTSDPTYGITQTFYDALGRTTQITKQDGNTVTTDYSSYPVVTVTDETGKQRRSQSDALNRLVEVDEPTAVYHPAQSATAGAAATAVIAINGAMLQSWQVQTQAAVTAYATVGITGSEKSMNPGDCPTPPGPPCLWDGGTVYVTVNGATLSGNYGKGSISSQIASQMYGQITSSFPATASLNSASITFYSKKVGAAGNADTFSSSVSYDDADFTGPSFNVSPISGNFGHGADAQYTTAYDSGTVYATINGVQAQYSWSGSSTTAGSIASGLAAAISAASPDVTAAPSGTNVIVTARQSGVGGNGYTITIPASTSQRGSFSNSVQSGFGGGLNPTPAVPAYTTTGFSPQWVTQYQYNALDNLISVNQAGDGSAPARTRSFVYDSLSRLITAYNPESGTTCYGTWLSGNCVNGYDADGNLLAKTDARNITTSYGYDPLHRITAKSYSDGSVGRQFFYDVTPPYPGLPASHGSSIGRLTHASNDVNSAYDPVYDAMGRVIAQEYCIPSDCSYGVQVSAGYDLAGHLQSLTYPDGRTVNYNYTSAGWLSSTTPPGSSSAYFSVSAHWPSGAWHTAQYGNGTQQTDSYNNRLQAQELKLAGPAASGSATLSDRSYSYAGCAEGVSNGNNGNVCAIFDALNGGQTQSFNYDVLNRLTSAVESDNAFNQAFTYDAWGNLVQNGTWAFTPSYSGQNQALGMGMQYDAGGHTTTDQLGHNYSFDSEGRLARNSMGWTYIYGPEGERIGKYNGGNWTNYVYFNGEIVAEKSANGGWSDYLFADGKRLARIGGTRVDVRFTNDSCSACAGTPGGGDRNLFVNSVTIGSTMIAPNDPSVSYTAAPCNSYTNGVGQILCNGDLIAASTASAASVTVNAWGSPDYNVYPQMQLWVNGALASEWDVTGAAQNYTVAVNSPEIGYYYADHLGTERLETDAGGAVISSCVYAPFGQEVGCPISDVSNHYKFTGKERDAESNLDYFGARYYANTMGRWMSPDWADDPEPVPYADLENPQSLNLYGYVNNNPLSGTDPDGHAHWGPCPGDSGSQCWTGDKNGEIDQGNGTVWNSKTQQWEQPQPPAPSLSQQFLNWRQDLISRWDQRIQAHQLPPQPKSDEQQFFETINNLMMGMVPVGATVRFGGNANQESHAFRHVEEAGISKPDAEAAIRNDLANKEQSLPSGLTRGQVNVGGRTLEYNAYKLPDGSINVGRITVH